MTVFQMARLRHVDLLVLAQRAGADDSAMSRLARMSKEQVIEWLCREARQRRRVSRG